jgi:hypothetical protein
MVHHCPVPYSKATRIVSPDFVFYIYLASSQLERVSDGGFGLVNLGPVQLHGEI